jgi:lipopolysaccharide/colanic/teichoic acid biosynthesis glycosyltransferase
MFSHLLVRLFGLRVRDEKRFYFAHRSRELKAVLLRERSRADRTESEFCLIQFIPQSNRSVHLCERLEQSAIDRIRVTDEVGNAGDGGVWLVLVDCPIVAAELIVQDVLRKAPECKGHFRVVLHHYPSDPWDAFHDDSTRVEVLTIRESDTVEPQPVAAHPIALGGLDAFFEVQTPIWKRAVDVLLAGAGLLLLAPLFSLVAILIKLDSPGPVFFRQRRAGRLGRPFTMYKFRSMSVDAEQRQHELKQFNEQDGPAFKIRRDPRITRVGRLLRASSIDELPQLWNVLNGSMTLVGPRPLPVSESKDCELWQRRRLDVTPGLTCFWQVASQRNRMPFDDWARLDILYIRKLSLLLDVKLLVKTFAAVTRLQGV